MNRKLIVLTFFVSILVVAYFLWQAQGVVNEAAPEKHSADKNSSFQADKYETSDFPVARGSGESEGITRSEAIARQKRAAVALVARLNQPSERAGRFAILEELARRLSESPISDAALVLNGINTPILRREALARLAVARVAEEPEAALRLAGSVIADKNHPVLSQLISSWATRNPQAAQAFVAQMQFGEMRQRASLALASTLAERDPNAAWQWAGAQSASWRASMMEAVITQIAEHQPDLAAQFAVQITDPAVLRRSLAEVGAAMLEINSESALAWAKQLPAAESTETIAALADQLSYDNPKEALGIVAALPQGSTRRF